MEEYFEIDFYEINKGFGEQSIEINYSQPGAIIKTIDIPENQLFVRMDFDNLTSADLLNNANIDLYFVDQEDYIIEVHKIIKCREREEFLTPPKAKKLVIYFANDWRKATSEK